MDGHGTRDHVDDDGRFHLHGNQAHEGEPSGADRTGAIVSGPHAGKTGIDHGTTVEIDGVLVEHPETIIEKDAGGVAHDVTDWSAQTARARDRAAAEE